MKKRKGKGLLILAIILFLGAFAALYMYIYVMPQISGALARTEIVTYGKMEVFDEVPCLFVRSEEVVYAQQAGNISYYAEETEKDRKDAKVLDVYPAGGSAQAYYCGKNGIVSYYLDGWEEKLYPEAIADLTLSEFEELDIKPENSVRESTEKDEPLFKVVTSDTWYIVFPIPMEKLSQYKEGYSVTLVFDDGEVTGKVDDIIGTEDTKLIAVSCKKFYANFAKIRQTTGRIITSSYEGLSVPTSAVATVDGQQGVYIKNLSNDYDFVPIEILTADDERTLITPDSFTIEDENGESKKVSSVSLYDEVLRDASRFAEQQDTPADDVEDTPKGDAARQS